MTVCNGFLKNIMIFVNQNTTAAWEKWVPIKKKKGGNISTFAGSIYSTLRVPVLDFTYRLYVYTHSCCML